MRRSGAQESLFDSLRRQPYGRQNREPSPLRVRLSTVVPLLIVTVACAVGSDRWPLWGDELWTLQVMSLPLGDMLAMLAGDHHPPGYFTALWLLLGDSPPDWVLRFPSLLGAVGTVAVTGFLGRRWFGETEGALAGLVLALSPFLLVFGGVARAYSLLAVTTSVLLLACAHLVSGDRVRTAAVGVALAGTVSVYLHYSAGAALVASAVGVAVGLWTRADRGRARRGWAAGAFLVVAVSFLPWLFGPLQHQDNRANSRERSLGVLEYLAWPVGPYQPAVNWALLAVACVGAGLLLRRRRPVDALLLACAACAVVIPYVLSTRADIQFKLYVQSWFLPGWALLVAAGLAPIARRVGLPAVGGAIAVGVAAPLYTLWSLPSGPFGVAKGNTAYDVRYDVRLFREVLPAELPRGVYVGPYYLRYAGEHLMQGATGSGWRFLHRDPHVVRGVYDPFESTPCNFVYAFLDQVTVDSFSHCLALLKGIEEVAAVEAYPPYLLELAAQAGAQGRMEDAVELAQTAADASHGWSDPAVFLVQHHARNGDVDRALAAGERGQEIATAWKNNLALGELYAMRAELLQVAGRPDEARLYAGCAAGQSHPPVCTRD